MVASLAHSILVKNFLRSGTVGVGTKVLSSVVVLVDEIFGTISKVAARAAKLSGKVMVNGK